MTMNKSFQFLAIIWLFSIRLNSLGVPCNTKISTKFPTLATAIPPATIKIGSTVTSASDYVVVIMMTSVAASFVMLFGLPSSVAASSELNQQKNQFVKSSIRSELLLDDNDSGRRDNNFEERYIRVLPKFGIAATTGPIKTYSSSVSNSLSQHSLAMAIRIENKIERDDESFPVVDASNVKFDMNKFKLCYAPKTKDFSRVSLTDISTIYSTRRDEKVGSSYGNKIGSSEKDETASNLETDERADINYVSSHLYIDNLLLGKHWISFSGKYEKISEILCRVVWERSWLDNSRKEDGPTGGDEMGRHIHPELVQFLGKRFIFPNSDKFPDLYSVYSPCLFR